MYMFVMSQFRFLFAVLCLTAILIFAVYLRETNNRIFYELCKYNVEQNRLKQKLGAKQLLLESLINPAAISQRRDESNTDN